MIDNHANDDMHTVPMAPPHAEAHIKSKFAAERLAFTIETNARGNIDGREVDTPEYTAFRAFLAECLMRHHQGDCGDMGDGDKGLNDAAIISGDRVFSMYQLPEAIAEGCPDPKIWIITDASDDPAKRFATTIMFPSEY